jgi:hypothetical protein
MLRVEEITNINPPTATEELFLPLITAFALRLSNTEFCIKGFLQGGVMKVIKSAVTVSTMLACIAAVGTNKQAVKQRRPNRYLRRTTAQL